MSSEIVNQDQGTVESSDERAARWRACPACGAGSRRGEARFCSTCGRLLLVEDGYLPADALRSSYHLQHNARASRRPKTVSTKPDPASAFSSGEGNAAATMAVAFVTYSLVPYLGILFCPGALIMGAIGLVYSFRAPRARGRRAAYLSITFGLLILGVQILLWWIIIKVPGWTRPF